MIICNLNILRAKQRISQKDLSVATNIRLQTISDMETGKTKSYSAENLNKLCTFFQCEIQDLIIYQKDCILEESISEEGL